jgi:uncharacterized membrane protein
MRENVGRVDRLIRAVVGPALTALGIAQLDDRRLLGVAGVILGAMVAESAITRVCPLHAALGIDTRTQIERLRDSRVNLEATTRRIAAMYRVPAVANDAIRMA